MSDLKTTRFIGDILDKYHSSYMERLEQTINQHIIDKIYKVTGKRIKIDIKKEVDRLQEDYCMYLITIDLNTGDVDPSKGTIAFKKGFEFFIEEPNPNEDEIHMMGCGIMFQKDEKGKWRVI